MPLPKIVTPEFSTILPSTGEEILFRPFFYLYGKISLILFNNSDYSIKLSNLFLHVFQENANFDLYSWPKKLIYNADLERKSIEDPI